MAQFRAEHRFSAPPGTVLAAMVDPSFFTGLELPDLEPPEVLDRSEDAGRVTLRLRIAFTGSLDPVARRVLGTSRVVWVQEVVAEPGSLTGELRVTPEVLGGQVRCHGTYRLAAQGSGTVRSTTGELSVRVPLVGGRAERAILPGIHRRLDLEAAALEAWLTAV